MDWFVYIVLCSDGTLYTGISNDVARRLAQHRNGQGAKYFRGRAPERLLYMENFANRSLASKRELGIKKMNRQEKWQLVNSVENSLSGREK